MIISECKDGSVNTEIKGNFRDTFSEFTAVARAMASAMEKIKPQFIPENISSAEALAVLVMQGVKNEGIFDKDEFVQYLKYRSESLSENGE